MLGPSSSPCTSPKLIQSTPEQGSGLITVSGSLTPLPEEAVVSLNLLNVTNLLFPGETLNNH